eukprot:1661993-Pleurochrysis_carterae.AAC.1
MGAESTSFRRYSESDRSAAILCKELAFGGSGSQGAVSSVVLLGGGIGLGTSWTIAMPVLAPAVPAGTVLSVPLRSERVGLLGALRVSLLCRLVWFRRFAAGTLSKQSSSGASIVRAMDLTRF